MKYFTLHSTMEEYNLVKNSLAKPHVAYVLEIQDIVTDGSLSLSVNSLSFSGSGGSESVTVMSPISSWTASTTDEWITLSQSTGGSGSTPISISVGTSQAVRNGSVSFTDGEVIITLSVHQEAEDVPYSQRYLTFDILTGGTIYWVSSGLTKTISYSINDGEWTEIASTTAGTPISVSAGDKVRLKGTNDQYGVSKGVCSCFSGGTAYYNVEGNIMSLIGGDNFTGLTTLSSTYAFHSLFDSSNAVSAENLILPATTLTEYCYRAMFSKSTSLVNAPELPATTLVEGCYWYMFDHTPMTTAPDLNAETLAKGCYQGMFRECNNLNYIKCMATNISASGATSMWVENVSATGTFVKDSSTTWTVGNNGIPTGWVVIDGVEDPVIACDGEQVTISCVTEGSSIYYKLDHTGDFALYTTPIAITGDTFVESYSVFQSFTSNTISQTCVYAPIVLANPVITSDGEEIFINCSTEGSSIYYKLDHTGDFALYEHPIPITADTFVEAYSKLYSKTSTTVSETCEYDPAHDYSKDYLTFRIRSNGKVYWHSNGNYAKTIDYRLNGGAWSSITASDSSTYIDVSSGDVVSFRGVNENYATSKSNYAGFGYGERGAAGAEGYDSDAAEFDIEGNIMSLIYGDNFIDKTQFNGGIYVFCSMFKKAKCVSAENLILPATTLSNYCYRAMFSWCTMLTTPPALPATTLAQGCYWYMFEKCSITTAPDLMASTLVRECYGAMFTGCADLNYIRCLATTGFDTASATTSWTNGVASTGTFVKDRNTPTGSGGWTINSGNGIPTNWLIQDEGTPNIPTIECDGFEIELYCSTTGADIYYRLTNGGSYSAYTTAITMTGDTFVECYSVKDGYSSTTTSMTCEYDDRTIYEYSNQSLDTWTRSGSAVTVPNSVNAIDGHSSTYARGTFDYETSVNLRSPQPTYLWFQHADQSADIYIDNVEVEKHWGGYAAFFVDISNSVHKGTNNIKVRLKNNEGNNLAPASGDFNFNATLGKVKLFTSPCLPAMDYGYDGFHITSTVSTGSATINVATNIPTGASVVCTISGVNCNYTATSASTGNEMIFTTTISNPRLWNGTIDPYLYNVKLEIYYNNELYHRYERPYGLRFYEYVINDTEKVGTQAAPYTGFLLNGAKYLLRGCCMHDDIAGKANALNDADYTQTFAIIQELGNNFLRLAHYPHPKEVYDWCDRLGIVVQTEGPCVNKLESTMPEAYWTNLTGQYNDMVNQHYNHPCIFFWGLSNEAKVDNKTFSKTKIEGYTTQIKALDSERMVGLVCHAQTNPSDYFGDPTNIDWIGNNLYNGWYQNTSSNNPTSQINTSISNTITRVGKAYALSEYGCGGTQGCHSETPSSTTNKGSGGARHDIEYMMWLHEGHIAAIKNKPELLFTSQWQLFDIAVSNRNEGYTLCADGVNTVTDDNLKHLNDKGLVERDHVTKKDPFYLYKAWWNTASTFVHICQKDYTKRDSRIIKCYTNDGNSLTLYVNGISAETVTVTDNIAAFTARNFNGGDVIMVSGSSSSDTFTFDIPHDYVEIGGIKWATMNIGAESITGMGLYFQWGDTSGYTSSQIGSGEGQKCFNMEDYKYWSSDIGSGSSGFTKYNSTDGKTVLDLSDDAARANWGGNWRMATRAEYETLSSSTTSEWVTDYQGSGVSGRLFTSKADSSVKLFFPANGWAGNCTTYYPSSDVRYLTSTNWPSDNRMATIFTCSQYAPGIFGIIRNSGLQIRAILDE